MSRLNTARFNFVIIIWYVEKLYLGQIFLCCYNLFEEKNSIIIYVIYFSKNKHFSDDKDF